MIGIYKITSPSGRVYIGQSIDIERRFYTYRKMYEAKQLILYRSFLKHGVENHIFEIIEECEVDDLNCRERHWQDFYEVVSEKGLNCVLQECGEKRREYSEEIKHIKKLTAYKRTGDKNPMWGKKQSEESKQKVRDKYKERQARGFTTKGIKKTDEHRMNLSKSRMGGFKGEDNPFINIYLNTQTFLYYFGNQEVADALNISISRFSRSREKRRKNNYPHIIKV